MSEYKKALYAWAAERIPAGADLKAVTDVSFDFDKGYGGGCDTCGWGADEDKMTVWISYTTTSGEKGTHSSDDGMYSFESGMGQVLRELFKIAEEE